MFMSRYQFKRAAPMLTEEYAVISVNDTVNEMLEIEQISSVPTLTLKFADNEESFDSGIAETIINFVEQYKDRKFIVHCFAGISRSAAISRWINLYQTGELPLTQRTYTLYNRHVFRTLEETANDLHRLG